MPNPPSVANAVSNSTNLLLDVTYVSIDLLKPYVRNARSHSRQQIGQIKASIVEFGFTNPILIDLDMGIIAGHGRLIAARELGLREVPAIILDALTPAQASALRIADNKIALNSGWDVDLLRLEFQELAAADVSIDLGVTGFSSGEIDVVLDHGTDVEESFLPPLRTKPRTSTGDIWILGNHRVGCGDGRDRAFLRKVIGDDRPVDCAFLDPPYNVRINGHANVKGSHREFAMASGEMSDSAFRTFLGETLGGCVDASRDGAVHFVCMDWRHHADLSSIAEGLYDEQLNLCVWNKSNAGMGSLYRSKHELVLVYRVGKASHVNAVQLGKHGRHRTNVWNYASVNSFRSSRRSDLALHPTVKPVAMVADAIKDVTRRGDRVLDTFLGAGTTLLAAEQTGRSFRGVDIDPIYVDLAVDRWVDLTGGQPQQLTGGKL